MHPAVYYTLAVISHLVAMCQRHTVPELCSCQNIPSTSLARQHNPSIDREGHRSYKTQLSFHRLTTLLSAPCVHTARFTKREYRYRICCIYQQSSEPLSRPLHVSQIIPERVNTIPSPTEYTRPTRFVVLTRAVVFIPQARSVAFRLLSLLRAVVGRRSSVGKHGHVAGGRTSSSDGIRRRWFALVTTSPCTLSECTHGACNALHCSNAVLKTGMQLHLPSKICRILHSQNFTFEQLRKFWLIPLSMPHCNKHSRNCRAMRFICTCGRMVHGTCCAA